MLAPDDLLAKINGPEGLKQAHAAYKDEIPEDSRLPDNYFDEIASKITAEKEDPDRVTRAASPPGASGPPAPPPVIYLSREPSVSQFMSVINGCFEQELHGPAAQGLLHLGNLDSLRRAIERLEEDLRSRFRRYGPCDIRFLEPLLAEVWAKFTNKHAFSNSPVDAPLAERATVILLGDWATGLPQARNVAAQITARVNAVSRDGVECHVIHLGDTYYSGLDQECHHRFLDLWPVPAQSSAKSWSLAGNHDMYSGGHGYFDVLLGDSRFNTTQRGCSYFALGNDHWQILGLDTSYKNPDNADLEPDQSTWLANRVADAGERRTVLLTHHQAFSAYEEVAAPLAATITAALGEHRVEAWIWGHEHRCAVYKHEVIDSRDRYRANANYTAIVGHGGVPQLLSGPATDVDNEAIGWAFEDYYQVGDDRWGLGGFAVLEFNGDTLTIQYYDEYGKEARTNVMGYPGDEAGIAQVTAAPDTRPVRPPDRLPQGASAQS